MSRWLQGSVCIYSTAAKSKITSLNIEFKPIYIQLY
jgi:hypothetical protein